MRKIFKTDATVNGDRTMTFLSSNGEVDRDNDMVDPSGWDLEHFRRNPVVLWFHDYEALPIGRCTAIWAEEAGLHVTVEFPLQGVYPDQVYDLGKQGFISATSVGFKADRIHLRQPT